VLRESPALNEKTLRTLWYEGRFERRGLKTVDGRPVSVVTPGEWNLDQGPDFRGAEFRLDGRTVRGDVEIHVTDRDWAGHGHDRDPGYDGVALHVFLNSSARGAFRPRRSDGAEVPSVSLMGRLPEPWSVLVRHFDAAGYPFNSTCGLGACGKKMGLARFDALGRLLELAADGRVLLKGETLGTDEARWAALARGLGFHRNKAGMEEVARRVSWAFLRAHAAAPREERAERIEALLFGAAGLLEGAEGTPEGRRMLAVWDEWRPAFGAAEPPIAWVFRGVRPQNFPHRRLAALARLADRALDGPAPAGSGPEAFLVGAEGFFARRAHWTSAPFARPAALVGPDRAQTLWVNVFLPAAAADARRRGDEAAERELRRRYAGLKLREPNGAARLMAHRLLGDERAARFPLKHEFQQQGLLQIFQDFCDTKPWACQVCVFPQVIDLSIAELNRG
jgi:hypothetical protein